MRPFSIVVASFALLAVCLPLIEAQAPKIVIGVDPNNPKKLTIGVAPKEGEPVAAQKDDKAPADKDDPKTDPKGEPKSEPKKIVRVDQSVVIASPRVVGKIKDLKAEQKEIVIVFVDPQKNRELLEWDYKTTLSIKQNPKLQTRDNILKYQADKRKRFDDQFSGETRTVTVSDSVRVRSLMVPPQFDAEGREKKVTASDLPRLKGIDSRLPGYVANFEYLREGQLVELYVVKQAATKKTPAPPVQKKGFIGEDPNLNIANPDGGKLDIHLIVVQSSN